MIKELIRFFFIGGSLTLKSDDFSLKTSNSTELRNHERLKICRKACKKLRSKYQDVQEEGERILSDKALGREAVAAMRECFYRELQTESSPDGCTVRSMIRACRKLGTKDSLELLLVVAAEAMDREVRRDAVSSIEEGFWASKQEERWPFPLKADTSQLLGKIVYSCPHDEVSAISARLLGQSEELDSVKVLVWALGKGWSEQRKTVHAAAESLWALAKSSNEKIRAAAQAPEVASALDSYRKSYESYRRMLEWEYKHQVSSGGPVTGVG